LSLVLFHAIKYNNNNNNINNNNNNICDGELFQWNRTPFGAKSSGQTFCRALQQVLRRVSDFASSFVDDMAVHSLDFQRHLEELDICNP